ncbi:hypothetical protein M407DRAFT_90017 [Tulasnella calospora MUT 4182]|uniref:Uncharacterized protein n=1 Tax=Tulasnella calospora MUT 4182 TaxID=1051891 RepID=A0A0C3QZC9_9AGAM|nr:hypothetical protein M407DRAFT_90017 [Tulasnella calospora MUT 4182]
MGTFSKVLPVLGTAFGLQALLGSVFVPMQSEKYFDFGGSLGFLSCALVSLVQPDFSDWSWDSVTASGRARSSRQLLATGALVLWSGRLGVFLLRRIIKSGRDSRFDVIKKNPARFFRAWILQGLWITIVGLPVWLMNTVPAALNPPMGVLDYVGLGIFVTSFALESVADYQKSQWRREKEARKHDDPFINRGLWRYSRHPNYAAEVGIHTGIAILASSAMPSVTLRPLAYISPLFTYFLLSKVSGVPLLERASDAKLGSDPKYQEYKRNTPVLFPWRRAGNV